MGGEGKARTGGGGAGGASLCGFSRSVEAGGDSGFWTWGKGAQLEGSKSFCKDLLVRQKIPTARAGSFSNIKEALSFLETLSCPVVVKADGLAAGKGVVIAESHGEAKQAMTEMMEGRVFGEAGREFYWRNF